MAQAYHVSGPAVIRGGTGASNALETIGVTEDGADIDIDVGDEPIQSDVVGTKKPAELQGMGMDAVIRVRLIAYDLAILKKWILQGDATTEGTLETAGVLLGTGGYLKRLLIDSATDDPYNFLTAKLRGSQKVKYGTKRLAYDLTFYAIAFVPGTATSAKGTVLYNHTNT